jgi:STE24 endopeptidase
VIQILPIILVAAVMAVDSGVSPLGAEWTIAPWMILLNLWLTPAIVLALAWLGVILCVKRLKRGRMPGPLIAAERLLRATRWLIAINQLACVLVLNGLSAVRSFTGDLILIDELFTLLPALLALAATWWVYFPIERILVEATLIRRMDEGRPVYPTQTRWQYLVLQVRMHMLLILVPVLVIAGLSELIEDVWAHWRIGPVGVREALTIAVAASVFLVAPLLARAILDVQSMPSGELRDTLSDVCRRHRVGVRDLLVWRTNGSMINAAVMGIIGRLRYVLITDALLEMLRREQVCAVMAHEVGHVRRHHMLWLIVCLMACFLLALFLVDWPLRIAAALAHVPKGWMGSLEIGSGMAQLALALWIFGWVCRRFERQADTFAVQHLSGLGGGADAGAVVTHNAVHALRSALGAISQLNTVDPSRHSWRHGSIRWRQRYLDSIVGKPIRGLAIDRLVRWLKVGSAFVLALWIGYVIVAREMLDDEPVPRLSGAQGALSLENDQSPESRAGGAHRSDSELFTTSARLTGDAAMILRTAPSAPVSRGTGLLSSRSQQ